MLPILFVLTSASLFVSTTIFVFSMLHLGSDTYFVIPVLFVLTLTYHITILIIDYRKSAKSITIVHPRLDLKHRPISSISSTLPSLVCASVLAALWAGAAGLAVVSTVLVLRKEVTVKGDDGGGRGGAVWLIFVQIVLGLLEVVVLVVIVGRSAQERKFGGPENWKRACEEAL